MKREKSWTELAYRACYQYMRRGIDFQSIVKTGVTPLEIIKGADYSYQAFNHELSGWSSEMRRKRFQAIKYRITSSGEYLPF